MDHFVNSQARVLIVEDEENISNFIRMGLKAKGFEVLCASDGNEAMSAAVKMNPHIVILDVMLPEIDGYTVCKEIKKLTRATVIMLTAKNDTEDIIMGLDAGADDYMVKPFDIRELVARINARLRNDHRIHSDKIHIGNFSIDNKAHEITYKDKLLELSSTEYNLLIYLINNHDVVLSKNIILQNVWGLEYDGEYNLVEVYISYLRSKIGEDAHDIIKTVRGVGYKVII
jgi:two-component system OmpR family response regulator